MAFVALGTHMLSQSIERREQKPATTGEAQPAMSTNRE